MPSAVSASEYLLWSILAFGPLAFGCVEPWSLAVLEIAIFSLCLTHLITAKDRFTTPAQKTLVPCSLALAALGLWQYADPSPLGAPAPLGPFTTDRLLTMGEILLYLSFAGLLWATSGILSDKARLRRFMWAVFLVGVCVAVAGIIQKGQGNTLIYGLREVRPTRNPFGPFYNVNHAACLMGMSFLLGLGLFTERFVSFRGVFSVGAISELISKQLLLVFFMAVLAAGLLATTSRGALMALVAGMGLTGALSAKFVRIPWLRWALRILGFASVGVYLWVFAARPAMLGLAELQKDGSALYRLSMYRSSWRMFQDFPLFGTGLGTFQAAYPPYQEGYVQGHVLYAHSDFVEFLTEAGLVGCIIVLVGLVLFCRAACKNIHALPAGERKGLSLGLSGAAAAFTLHCLFEFNFQIPGAAVVFLCTLAALGSKVMSHTPTEDEEDAPRPRLRRPALAAAVCATFILCGLSLSPAIAQYYTWRAKGCRISAKPYFLERAISWHPEPSCYRQLAATYLELADANPQARLVLLRAGLEQAQKAVQARPYDPRSLQLRAALVWRLGRAGDA
ncbi:MAG: O-antigen ligase family protein [Elusimicrobiota bacterium]